MKKRRGSGGEFSEPSFLVVDSSYILSPPVLISLSVDEANRAREAQRGELAQGNKFRRRREKEEEAQRKHGSLTP